jgi:tripartite-type tricarboxylate transporter receptor subunit TctC
MRRRRGFFGGAPSPRCRRPFGWFRRAGTAAALLMALVAPARADDYPTHPVKLIVSFPAGGASDILGRAIAQKLSESWASRW